MPIKKEKITVMLDLQKEARRTARELIGTPPSTKKFKDKSKYTRKKKHKNK